MSSFPAGIWERGCDSAVSHSSITKSLYGYFSSGKCQHNKLVIIITRQNLAGKTGVQTAPETALAGRGEGHRVRSLLQG